MTIQLSTSNEAPTPPIHQVPTAKETTTITQSTKETTTPQPNTISKKPHIEETAPYPDMTITHHIEHNKEKNATILVVKTTMPTEYIIQEQRNQRTSCIVRNYFKNLKTTLTDKQPFGVRIKPPSVMEFIIHNVEWNSPYHIHLLTVVRELIMPDVGKLMGEDWQNTNFKDDET